MEEIYILSDGSQVDLSGKSQFEKTNFLIKNPTAKKQKGVAKSADVAPKKNQALNNAMGSSSTTGSLGSTKKYRLADDNDFETMQKRGLAPPPSAMPKVNIDLNNLYSTTSELIEKESKQDFRLAKSNKLKTLLENKPIFKAKTFEQKLQEKLQEDKFKTVSRDNTAVKNINLPKEGLILEGKLGGTREQIKKLVDNFSDNPVTGELGENSKIKISNLKQKIQETDSDLLNPYLYYSSKNQNQPDTFIQDNYNAKELSSLGINLEDFDGYINKKGYKKDFLDKQEKGLYEGQGKSFWYGYDIGLAKELAKKKLLNMYMEDMQRRDFTRQDLNQDIEVISGLRDKKEIVKNQLFNQDGVTKYVEKNFPLLTQKLKDRDKENARIYEESKKGGTDFFSWDTGGKMGSAGWNAITDRVAQFFSTVDEAIGLKTTAEGIRMFDEENKLVRPDNRGIAYASGKTTNYKGTNYIVDSKGEIYDTDAKIRVTDIFNENAYKKIVEESKLGQEDWVFSTQGAAVQTSGIMADMLLQAALTRGVGRLGMIGTETRVALNAAKPTSRFTSLVNDTSQLLRKVPIERATGYSMIAQGAMGYSQGYEETLKAARDNGINDKEAFKLAASAAQRMAVLYSTTGVINPQTKIVENVFGSKNMIKKAIEQYTKTGEKGFINYIDDVIKNTPRNLIEFAEEGGKEVVQENIQQVGEIGINKMTNVDAGKKIMNEVMSGDDFMNTSILSFISSGLISKAKLPNFHGGNQAIDDLTSLSTLAKNKKEFVKIADGLLDKKVFTPEQIENLKNDVNTYSNNINKLPKSISPEAAMPVMRELDKVTKLLDEKETVDKAFHPQIDQKIDGIRNNINKIYYESELKVKNEAISKAIQKGVVKEIQMKSFSNTEDLKKYLVEELNMSEDVVDLYSSQVGFAITGKTLKEYSKNPELISDNAQIIVVNESKTLDAGVIQHEFLHGLLQNTLKDNPEAQKLIGVALSKELMKIHDTLTSKGSKEKVISGSLMQRIGTYVRRSTKQKEESLKELELKKINAEGDSALIAQAEAEHNDYIARVEGVQWEEMLTLYSDALRSGEITYNEGTFVKLGDMLRRVLQYLGIKDIKFESGKDVYNFIKDYNSSVESGNWGKAFKKMGEKGAVIDIEKLSKGTDTSKTTVQKTTTKSDFRTDAKFSLAENRKSSEDIKKDVNKKYDKEQWSSGSNSKDENPAINNALYDILNEYEYIIKGKSKGLGYANLPDFSEMDFISETQIAMIPLIRNFNKEFFQKREEYKKELEAKGLDPKSKEFKDKVEAQDEKGYQGKKGIVKENTDLNAYINSQLANKMKDALKSGNVTSQMFTDDIQGEGFKETRVLSDFAGDSGEESGFLDESDSVFDAEQDFEEEQSNLAVLLSDPIFNFTDEKGKPINIETVPFGGFFVTEASDPTVAANRKLKTETDPAKIADLNRQLKELDRGLELQSKKDITPDEKEELKELKSFKSYDLSTGMMVNTFEALSVQDTPAKIITDEVGREILRSPNIETLEYRNFKEKLSFLSKTMARRMTFKNGPEIESLMYNQWKLLYDVINNPVDPVTGESSYASKKLPPRLKETDDKGDFKKIKDISRVKFLQSYYGIDEASRIIKIYGGPNANKELNQFEEPELSEKDKGLLRPTTYFDRRTALMELFGDVLVLQEARRLIRQPEFLDRVAERNVNLANDLKNEVIRAKVLDNMAKGKSDIVKFSLAEEENGRLSNFLEGLPLTDQWTVARDIDNAIKKGKIADGTKVDFNVPSRSKFSDKQTAYFLIQKVADGYNNFEFKVKKNAGGPLTKQVLEALDYKSKKYQETVQRNNNLEKTINDIIEENKGVKSSETFSPETAKNLGKNIGKYDIFLPPEDEDFVGLLYTLATAKGVKGEEQLKFLRDNLLKPYSDAMLNLMKARQTMYKDWKQLINKKHKGISKLLKSDSGYGGYLIDQAVRVYLWKKAGYEIPGLDKKDVFNLVEKVRTNKKLRDFADDVSLLSKQANGYIEPTSNWGFGSVVGDINDIISKSNRKKYLEPWVNNIDKAFSKDNLSKIEAIYGRKYVVALKNILERMKTGSNRAEGSSDTLLNWLNGATAVTMFANMRSAILQTIGAINYINTSDNNILKAGAALLNVPQYLEDYKTIWNSDYLKDRRSGLMNDVAEAELAQIMNDPRNKSIADKFKAANFWILKNGYAPTRFADSFAVAFGGAGFYRNRLNTYLKEGKTEEEAIKLTQRDFYEISEQSQQSADVSKISMNQASVKGRLILAFQNTPLQYSRLIKRSVIDLIKGRGSVENNIAKILYYGAVQNIMFNFLQNALFSMFWDDDDEQAAGKFDSAKIRAANGTMDTFLRGSGLRGAILATVKNAIVKWYEKSGDPKGYGDVLLEVANLAPSIGIKTRGLAKAYKAIEYNMDEIKYKGFSLDNQYAIEAATSLTSASTNFPVDRLYIKTQNVANALNSDYQTWQRIAFLMGFNKWNLGIGKSAEVSIDTRGKLKIPELKASELKTPELK
jgi:hypothetical protein